VGAIGGIEAERSLAEDFKSLLDLSRTRAVQARERYAVLADELYGAPRGLLADAERSLLTGMIHGLIDGIAATLRPLLAAKLGRAGAASAVDEVASEEIHRALRQAGFLGEWELIESAYHRMLEFNLESLMRSRAKAKPAATGAEDFAARILRGASLELAHAVAAFLVAGSKRWDAYQNPLLLPSDLPEALARRLHWAVGVAFRAALESRFAANDPALDDAIEDTAGETLAHALADPGPAALGAAVARRLDEAGLAGTGLLVPLFEQGEFALFEAVLSRLTGLAPVLLRRFLFEPGGEALAICARALGIDRAVLAGILEATREARQRPRVADGDGVAAALDLYDRLPVAVASHMLRRWARGRDYQAVLRSFETPQGGGAPSGPRPKN